MRTSVSIALLFALFGSPSALAQSAGLRRLRNDEVTPAISAAAVRILRDYRGSSYGTEVPFQADGRSYVGRIERHYHPPGGAARPWGYHPGVSVFEDMRPGASSPATSDALEPVRQGRLLLRWGSRGSEVRALQVALTSAGHPLGADGAFGRNTDAAVRRFQASTGLRVDGIVGSVTVAALDRALVGATPLIPSPAPNPPPSPDGLLVTAIPPRPAGALAGGAFLDRTASLSRPLREDRILQAFEQGNVPGFLRRFRAVQFSATLTSGRRVEGTAWVSADYLAIGGDDDFVRVPMNPLTAQRVADRFGCALPTRKIVDAIWRSAEVKLDPIPLTPSAQMMSNAYTRVHDARVRAQLAGSPLGRLVAGHKKDVVLSNRLATRPDRVAIYGWHRRSGRPIQPLSTVHVNTYADYSHGVRLVHEGVLVDGRPMRLADALQDPDLWRLFSDEGRMPSPRIPGA